MWWNLLLAYLNCRITSSLWCAFTGEYDLVLCWESPAVWFIPSVSSLFCFSLFFFYFDESQFNKPLFPAQFSCHPLNCLNSCSFHGCENSVYKCFEIPQCTPRQATCARSAAWRLLSVLPSLSTALELVVSCMDGVLAVRCIMYQPEGLWVSYPMFKPLSLVQLGAGGIRGCAKVCS